MGGLWLLDTVMEASELPPESLALFDERMVVMFPEGRTMQEKSSEERRVLKKLVDNGGTESRRRLGGMEKRRGSALPNGANRPDQKRLNTERPLVTGFSASVGTEGEVGGE